MSRVFVNKEASFELNELALFVRYHRMSQFVQSIRNEYVATMVAKVWSDEGIALIVFGREGVNQ